MKKYGKWIIKKSLPEGGQAYTYLVGNVDDTSGKLFVLKRLKNIARKDRFLREIEALQKLSHPNIIRIIDFDYKNDPPYIVTEYCEGGPLSKLDLKQYSILEKLKILELICTGVGYAHEKGFIHRDLKPDNIFLRKDGRTPVVGDFGIILDQNHREYKNKYKNFNLT